MEEIVDRRSRTWLSRPAAGRAGGVPPPDPCIAKDRRYRIEDRGSQIEDRRSRTWLTRPAAGRAGGVPPPDPSSDEDRQIPIHTSFPTSPLFCLNGPPWRTRPRHERTFWRSALPGCLCPCDTTGGCDRTNTTCGSMSLLDCKIMKREFSGSSFQPLTEERPKGRAQWVVGLVVAIGLLILVAWAMRSLTSASPLLCQTVFPDGMRLDVMGVSKGERTVEFKGNGGFLRWLRGTTVRWGQSMGSVSRWGQSSHGNISPILRGYFLTSLWSASCCTRQPRLRHTSPNRCRNNKWSSFAMKMALPPSPRAIMC